MSRLVWSPESSGRRRDENAAATANGPSAHAASEHAANNISVYYQGLDDEILQRLEVGDVSIRLPTSRYLTQGIPAGNFGFKAVGQVGQQGDRLFVLEHVHRRDDEGLGGAREMVKEGLFERFPCDRVFGLHVVCSGHVDHANRVSGGEGVRQSLDVHVNGG